MALSAIGFHFCGMLSGAMLLLYLAFSLDASNAASNGSDLGGSGNQLQSVLATWSKNEPVATESEESPGFGLASSTPTGQYSDILVRVIMDGNYYSCPNQDQRAHIVADVSGFAHPLRPEPNACFRLFGQYYGPPAWPVQQWHHECTPMSCSSPPYQVGDEWYCGSWRATIESLQNSRNTGKLSPAVVIEGQSWCLGRFHVAHL